MIKFSKKKFLAWEETRQKGLLKFMVINGGLFFGLPLGIVFTIFDKYFLFFEIPLIPQLLLYTAIGAFFNWPVWILNEISREAYFKDHGNVPSGNLETH